MRCHSAHVCSDEHLQNGRFIVSHEPNHRKPIAAAILDGPAGTLGLISGPVLLLGLCQNLQLDFAVPRGTSQLGLQCDHAGIAEGTGGGGGATKR